MTKQTPSQFVDILDRALVWRKKELTTLKFTVSRARRHQQGTLLRAAVCLLYAHWEGFFKDAATKYVRYVASQDLYLEDVAIHFLALALRSKIRLAGQSSQATLHTSLVNEILCSQNQIFKPNWREAVVTGSNLDSKHLIDILCLVGVDYTEYLSKAPLLDKRLVDNRNAVAHGEGLPIGADDYIELHEVVVALLDQFRNDLEDAVISSKYKRV